MTDEKIFEQLSKMKLVELKKLYDQRNYYRKQCVVCIFICFMECLLMLYFAFLYGLNR